MIYEPAEDSFLLQKFVKEYAKGIVLDMGTGSGIQALEAAKSKQVSKVYALDLNKQAISYDKSNIKNKKIIFLFSDLFNVFRINKKYETLKFDTIIFNAPYLPEDPNDEDLALDGGKKGYELIQRFLRESIPFLKPKTKILLVFSSLSDPYKIENLIHKHRMHFKELAKEHIFFEDILVYLIEPTNIH